MVLAKILGVAVCRDHPDMVPGDGRRMDLGIYLGRLATYHLGTGFLRSIGKTVPSFATFA